MDLIKEKRLFYAVGSSARSSLAEQILKFCSERKLFPLAEIYDWGLLIFFWSVIFDLKIIKIDGHNFIFKGRDTTDKVFVKILSKMQWHQPKLKIWLAESDFSIYSKNIAKYSDIKSLQCVLIEPLDGDLYFYTDERYTSSLMEFFPDAKVSGEKCKCK